MFPISLPSPSNTIRGQAGQCDWHFFICPDVFPKSPYHICCAVLFLGSSSCLISSVPFQLNVSCPCILSALDTAQEYFSSLFQLWNQFHILLFFLPSLLLCLKLKFTAMYDHSMNFLISSQFPFHIPHSLLPTVFTFQKGTSELLSAIINHCSNCLLCYFSHLLPRHL